MKQEKNSYEIIEDAVIKFWKEIGYPQDVVTAITKSFTEVLFTPNNRYDFERQVSNIIVNSLK